jgi:hypothetical protein
MLQRYMHKEHLYPCQPAKDRVMMIAVAHAVAHYSVSLMELFLMMGCR